MINYFCVYQLHQRTVSQQTSFDAPGLHSPTGRVWKTETTGVICDVAVKMMSCHCFFLEWTNVPILQKNHRTLPLQTCTYHPGSADHHHTDHHRCVLWGWQRSGAKSNWGKSAVLICTTDRLSKRSREKNLIPVMIRLFLRCLVWACMILKEWMFTTSWRGTTTLYNKMFLLWPGEWRASGPLSGFRRGHLSVSHREQLGDLRWPGRRQLSLL